MDKIVTIAVLSMALWGGANAVAGVVFERDVRPILKAHCFDCHGEAGVMEGGLDLRLRRLIAKGGESGAAIKEGHPEESLLYQKVQSGEMPKRDKKLDAQQIEVLRQWILDGAVTARAEPEEIGDGMLITEEERSHWAFRELRRPPIPNVKQSERVRTPVDAFVAAELERRGLVFSKDGERLSLIRRVYFDLIGIPPSPEEVRAFLEDQKPDAYERLVDRLLSSPHYGERWGRHWLDVAGYADSDGYTDADTPREYAYKYRDYVIRAFNSDKPMDQFITEQLAGDELVPTIYGNPEGTLSNAGGLEKLVATGFLRMGPDGTGTGGVDQDAARNQVVADTIKILSTSLLGLSIGCAQCHDHRYDPIPQEDYYRLRAVLEPAYDWKNWRTPSQRLLSLYTASDRAEAASIEAEAKNISEEKERKQKQFISEALEKHLEKFDADLREPLRHAFNTPADQRTDEQKKLLAEHPSVNIHPGVLYQYNPKAADELKAMDAKIAEVRARKPVEDFVQALTEKPGTVPETYLFHRGDPKQPKGKVQPGGLSVLGLGGSAVRFPENDPELPTTGRRLALARWLTDGRHPLVPRVLVNRVWMHHFGRGLVATPADFGTQGQPPTHPELLDWIAHLFVSPETEGTGTEAGLGWRLKRLHRLILTSTVYRQSSMRDAKMEAADPENRLYWRKPIQRLDAEAIRDSILAASGALNRKMSGPAVPVREDLVGQIVVGVDKKQGDNKMPVEVEMGGEEFRRSIYVQVRRSRPLNFMNVFDAPVMDLNCERRENSIVPTQSLMMMNSRFILDEAARFADRVLREAGPDPRDRIQRAWWLALSRPPAENEIQEAAAFLERQIEYCKSREAVEPVAGDGKQVEQPKLTPEKQALANLCQAVLSANEFLYVD